MSCKSYQFRYDPSLENMPHMQRIERNVCIRILWFAIHFKLSFPSKVVARYYSDIQILGHCRGVICVF